MLMLMSSTSELSNSVVLLAAVTAETAVGFTNMSVSFSLLAAAFRGNIFIKIPLHCLEL